MAGRVLPAVRPQKPEQPPAAPPAAPTPPQVPIVTWRTGDRVGVTLLLHERTVILASRRIDILDLAEHPLVENLVQPPQRLRLDLIMRDRDIGFGLGRILAEQAAVLAEIQREHSLVERRLGHRADRGQAA